MQQGQPSKGACFSTGRWKVQQLFMKYAAENAVAAMKICFAKQHVHEINLTSMEASTIVAGLLQI